MFRRRQAGRYGPESRVQAQRHREGWWHDAVTSHELVWAAAS